MRNKEKQNVDMKLSNAYFLDKNFFLSNNSSVFLVFIRFLPLKVICQHLLKSGGICRRSPRRLGRCRSRGSGYWCVQWLSNWCYSAKHPCSASTRQSPRLPSTSSSPWGKWWPRWPNGTCQPCSSRRVWRRAKWFAPLWIIFELIWGTIATYLSHNNINHIGCFEKSLTLSHQIRAFHIIAYQFCVVRNSNF